jgi:hypothetical protein
VSTNACDAQAQLTCKPDRSISVLVGVRGS